MKQCSICGSKTTKKQVNGKYDHWRTINKKRVCCACHYKYYYWTNQRFREIRFCGRRVLLTFNIRTGICSECNRKLITNMHHYMGYWIIFPWFATRELCVRCHSKTIKRNEKKGFYVK